MILSPMFYSEVILQMDPFTARQNDDWLVDWMFYGLHFILHTNLGPYFNS